jgi:predicted esterase
VDNNKSIKKKQKKIIMSNNTKTSIYQSKLTVETIPVLSTPHRATIILLHGIGSTGSNWVQDIKAIHSKIPHIKFILPNAPIQSVTVLNHQKIPSWFDITGNDHTDKHQGIQESKRSLDQIIEDEIKQGTPSRCILLGGWSQGGPLALLTGYHQQHELAGIFCMSSFLPLDDSFNSGIIDKPNQNTPLFISHGDSDKIVSVNKGRAVHALMILHGVPITYKEYKNVGHEVGPDLMNDLIVFVQQCLR